MRSASEDGLETVDEGSEEEEGAESRRDEEEGADSRRDDGSGLWLTERWVW